MIHVYEDNETLCEALAIWIEEIITETLSSKQRFTFALSGGSTPKLLYSKLSIRKNIEWDKIHFFWGDERDVPQEDERNNAGMARRELLDKVPVKSDNVHVIPTNIDLDSAITEYNRLLHEYFPGERTFDLVLLGMGNDGHTLSLFPGSKLLDDKVSWVNTDIKPGENISRITLMPAIVNSSRYIVFLVSGLDKSEMLKNVLELDPYYPANLINPISGELHWFLDSKAASLLKK